MTFPAQFFERLLACTIAFWLISASTALSADPEIRNIDVRGLTVGSQTTLTIDGINFSSESRLFLPFDVNQEVQPGATTTRAVFNVTVPASVVPGMYNLRIVNADGVSSPIVIGVDALPQLPMNAVIASLPVALHGSVGGSTTLETHFRGTVGEEIILEVEAARMGSKLRPVLHLLDSQRQQIDWAWTSPQLHGDVRLTAKLPADGDYTVTLHDLEFGSPAPNFFRLKIGRWDSVDQVFPPVVGQKEQSVELMGDHGQTSAVVPIADSSQLVIPLPWPDAAYSSGLRPWVAVSTSRELLELNPSETPQDLGPVPVAVSGRISAPSEVDRYLLTVTPGTTLRFEMTSEQLGSPLDGVIVLMNDQGGQLARGDDSPGSSDPVLEYPVPANVNSLIVELSDALRRGGAGSIYRLMVSDKTSNEGGQGFRLLAQNEHVSLLPGSRQVLPIIAERNGYDGSVQITLKGLPEGVVAEGLEIPASADGTLLTLQIPEQSPTEPPVVDATVNPAPAVSTSPDTVLPRPAAHVTMLSVQGTSTDGTVTRNASFASHPLADLQPWLSKEISLAVASPSSDRDSSPAGFQIDWNNLPVDSALVLAGKLTLPIQLMRPAGEATPVRLSLITSQNIPQLNGNPDLNKAVRAEAAVEITADKLDGQLVAVTPPDLPGEIYDITVKAELMTANKQAVLATAFAPVRRLNTVNPVGLKLTGEPAFEATLDPAAGASVVVAGMVERRAGMAGAVTVTLTGLPGGVTAANVVVKPEESAFEIAIKFPATFVSVEPLLLELIGSGPPDPAQAGIVVKSKPIAINVKVTRP